MAYMDQQKKKIINDQIKPILKRYGVKGSLSVRNHMAIVLTLKEGRLDFWKDRNMDAFRGSLADVFPGHLDINQYHYKNHYIGESLNFLSEVFAALKSAGWYDKSDAMTDYFDTAYYYDVQVGRWNKPYQLTN